MAFWNRKKEDKPRTEPRVRMFDAAQYKTNLDMGETLSINQDILGGLNTIRRRARNLVANTGYAAGIIINLKNNIIGARGITLTCQAKNSAGELDDALNDLVEDEWELWGWLGNCDVTGKLDWVKLQELALTTTATDGESLFLIRRGKRFGRYMMQLDMLPIDNLDENYFAISSRGNVIYQGVEIDEYGKPLYYHIWQHNRLDNRLYVSQENRRLEIPAYDIIHLFDPVSPKQVRAISWLVASMINLHQIDLLQNTELQMARLATLKQVVYTIDKPEDYQVGDEEIDAAGAIKRDISPGQVEVLPPGVTPHAIDWASPHSGLADITKTILRSVSSASGISYNAIAKDLESVNYSSARFGSLEDRVTYQGKQRWIIGAFHNVVFERWLDVQLINDAFLLSEDKYDEILKTAKWNPRGFQAIDPDKEAKANALDLFLGVKTRSDICAERGQDYEEVLQEAVQEEKMRVAAYKAAGLELPPNSVQSVPIEVAKIQTEGMLQNAE